MSGYDPLLPAWYVVYDLLMKSKEGITDKELYELLMAKTPWVSIRQFSEALLKLEATGRIKTAKGAKKNTLLVQLAEEGRKHLFTDEE